jgi:hypothetical protein
MQDDDGSAYIAYSSEHNKVMHIGQLTADFRNVGNQYLRTMARYPPFARVTPLRMPPRRHPLSLCCCTKLSICWLLPPWLQTNLAPREASLLSMSKSGASNLLSTPPKRTLPFK